MQFLTPRHVQVTVHVADTEEIAGPLTERLADAVRLSPHLVLQLEGVLLTSLKLGELVTLARTLQETWGESFRGLVLRGLAPQGRLLIERSRLEALLRVEDGQAPAAAPGSA